MTDKSQAMWPMRDQQTPGLMFTNAMRRWRGKAAAAHLQDVYASDN